MKSIMNPIKRNIILFTVIAILVIVSVAFVVIGVVPYFKGNPSGEQTDPPEVIVTPYCELRYPGVWKEQMTVKELTSDDVSSYVFCALIEEKYYELYTVHFGKSERGDLFGFLPANGGDIPIYVECHTAKEMGEMTPLGLSLFYSMMEGVNDVTRSIASSPGYYKP